MLLRKSREHVRAWRASLEVYVHRRGRRRLDTAPSLGAAGATPVDGRPASAGAALGAADSAADSGDMTHADGLEHSIMSMLQLGEAGADPAPATCSLPRSSLLSLQRELDAAIHALNALG